MDKTTLIVLAVFVAIVAVSVVIQVCVLVAMFLAARKTQQKVHALMEDFRVQVLPVVSSSRALIEDLSPKIRRVASDLVDSSNNLRTMAADVSGVVGDVASRARMRTAQVDDMVQGTVDHISSASTAVQRGVSAPLRQLSGIFNGLRAGMNVIFQKDSPDYHEAERDLFI